ncbi:uncharacterized protein LACBIDRAFT_333529 [Laccaria bicolor S238N-H82]|uniref:Predicted protein n=1 Tax=Laccaria bicolor (strain S238N-H82 / ATCC MYA-4686) TaxID=486041 RepID=B0DW75_LACBS|nr:uncharacterized protein LACBIDRAFT_333529 [Laccaria bicolor S238N-H82]EDR01135.1 predicted protein [Laccaria bicolor S238N-H82]|eukprot:XP_001888177.1 predicted protein [Laccaria bicolor S238N-H82]
MKYPGHQSLSSVNFFLKDSFRLDEVLDSSDYDFEIVALRPGDRLFMMPCQPHFVFGYAHSICLDPAASHLPDIKDFTGLMDLLSACVLVILGNVLDFRTYRAPSQDEYKKANKNQQILIDHEINSITIRERFAICYARGVALHLINWIRICSEIRGPGGAVITDLPSRFFIQITQTLIKYKEGANTSKLDLQANCTLGMLMKQIENIVKVDPHILTWWSERHLLPSGSLALENQEEYSVRWPESRRKEWSSINHEFMEDGITPLDRLCFESQQDRQHFESSMVIPHLKTNSSAMQHPPKRTCKTHQTCRNPYPYTWTLGYSSRICARAPS